MTLRYALLLSASFLFATATLAQTANDDCGTAITIACGESLAGSTADALPDEALDCGTTVGAPGVWYFFQGNGQQVTATTCPDNAYDTKLNVYVGNCGTITCLAGNDDIAQGVLCSSVTFVAETGNSYYILVQGYNGAVGTFDLAVTCAALTEDVCAGALPIACGQTLSGTTTGASDDTAPECDTGISAPGVWYTFTGTVGQMTVTTCPNNTYDTKLNVYTGPCTDLNCVAGNDDISNGVLCSSVTFNSVEGTTYYVLVQGYDGENGPFELALTCVSCGQPQSVTATPLDVSAVVSWSSSNASAEYTVEYGPAGFTPGTGTPITGTYGVDGPPVNIAGLTAGTDYEVYITEDCGGGDLSPSAGPVAFTTLLAPPAENAFCDGALPIACGGNVTGNTTLGFFTPAPMCGPANVSTNGLWYNFIGTGEDVTMSTCSGTGFDTKISVFTGPCNALTCVSGSDDAPNCPGNGSSTVFHTTAGTEYFVMVHGYDQSQGAFTLTMTCTAPCTPVENDNCTNPTPLTLQLTGGCETSTGTNECAFATGVPNPPCDPWGNIVDTWYSFNSSWATNLTLSLEAVDAEFVNAAIYTACDAPEYIECWTGVDAPIALNVPANTELLLRIWNGGGVDAGTYNVCVEGDFNVGVSASTGSAGQLIQLYPVPVRDVLTAQPLDGIATLTVVDLQGRTLMSTSTNGMRSAQLDVNTLAPGSYVLLGDGSMVGRFVKE